MGGIVGIAKPQNTTNVEQMLEKIAYRGRTTKIVQTPLVTLGLTYSRKKVTKKKHGWPVTPSKDLRIILYRRKMIK